MQVFKVTPSVSLHYICEKILPHPTLKLNIIDNTGLQHQEAIFMGITPGGHIPDKIKIE